VRAGGDEARRPRIKAPRPYQPTPSYLSRARSTLVVALRYSVEEETSCRPEELASGSEPDAERSAPRWQSPRRAECQRTGNDERTEPHQASARRDR
jgi:hypothetical protein